MCVCVLFVEITLFKRALKHGAEVWPPITNYKAVMCLLKKTCVFVKLHSTMSSRLMDEQCILNKYNKYL